MDGEFNYDFRENIYQRSSTEAVNRSISIGADNSVLVFKNSDESTLQVMSVCPLSHIYDSELSACLPCSPTTHHSLGIQAGVCLDCLALENEYDGTENSVIAAQIELLCAPNRNKSYFLVIATPILFVGLSVFFFFVERNCLAWCPCFTKPGKGVMLGDETDNERENKIDTDDEGFRKRGVGSKQVHFGNDLETDQMAQDMDKQ